jgi:hypothetical protein
LIGLSIFLDDHSGSFGYLTIVFPGFLVAVVYVMWLRNRITWSLPLAVIPMMGFWSPLAMAGALPFAVHVGRSALVKRQVCVSQIVLPLAATVICLFCRRQHAVRSRTHSHQNWIPSAAADKLMRHRRV